MSTDAPPDWLLALIPLSFLIGFPLIWVSVVFLLSRLSGWSKLAQTYREQQPFVGQLHRRCSATLGLVGYNKTLVLGANEHGLHLAVPRIFALGHPPLFVPWADVEAERGKTLWVQTVGLRLGKTQPVTLKMQRRFADPLEAASQGHLRIAPENR